MITQERLEFKPFEYQWAYEAWFKQQNAQHKQKLLLMIIGQPM